MCVSWFTIATVSKESEPFSFSLNYLNLQYGVAVVVVNVPYSEPQ